MTTKEIEILSGMDRANIRFYERQGLITPNRMDNGYRDYRETDLQILLRIKLLRSIHISLDDIKFLKAGVKKLEDILSKQIIELEKEKQGVCYAQDVCSLLMEDRVAFENLDAKKYLDGIDRTARETGSSYLTYKDDEFPYVFYPWRRLLARVLDLAIYNVIWWAILIFVFHVNLSSRSNMGNVFDTFISLAIMLLLEPLWLSLLGTTPGKLVFGLRIEAPDGRRLSYSEGLERTWGVVGVGMGYNIPIYNLVRLWKSYERCSENEIQPWDDGISYTIKDTRGYRGVVWLGVHVILFGLLAISISTQQLPPNRGQLTIGAFAENYNYYADFFHMDFGNKYLNERGKWEEKAFDGTAYIEILHSDMLNYNYTIQNGYITGISVVVELENNKDWIGSYDNQLILASLAFAGAQDEMGLLSTIPKRIVKEINNNNFGNFNFTESDVEYACNVKHSGYLDTYSGLLIPEEYGGENYFRLEYSVNKLK